MRRLIDRDSSCNSITRNMFDIAKSHDAVVAVLTSHATVADGMAQLIDFCADQESWRGWSALLELNFAADEERLKRWLQGVLTKEPPQKSIKAFWFGLYIQCRRQSDMRYVYGWFQEL